MITTARRLVRKIQFTSTLIFFSAVFSAYLHAKPAPEETAALYAQSPARSLVALSPGGDMVAFRTKNDDQDIVLVYSLSQNETVTGLDVSDIDPWYLHFINDEYLVLVASQERRIMGFRGRHDISTGYALEIKTGDVEQLLRPGDVIFKGQTGLGDIVGISEDHQTLFMPAFVGRSSTDQNPDLALMAVDIKNPRRPKLVASGHADTVDYFVDGAGELKAQTRYDEKSKRLSIWIPDGKRWEEIFSHTHQTRQPTFLGVTEDRQSLLMLIEDKEDGSATYHRLDFNNGELTPLDISRDDTDISAAFTGAGRVAMGVRYAGFTPGYHFFDEALNKRIADLQGQLPEHVVHVVDISEDQEHIVIYLEGSSSSGDYYIASKDQPLRFLTSARPGITETQVHPIVQFNYKARDGLTIPALLTIPREHAQAPENLPAIIYPHGGPETNDEQGFDKLAQAMASHGYAVIQPQFRGSTGFGQAHWEAGQGEWGRAMQDDLDDALTALGKGGLVDADRVCIVGASYGGYAALAGAAFTPGQYRCVISIHGVSDLNKIIEYERKEHGEDAWVVDYFSRSMARDYFTPERLAAHSPANFANGVQAPVLLIHGETDEVVPIEQSELMRDRLKAANKSVEFMELKDTGHSYGDEAVRTTLFTRILSFLDEHLATADTGNEN